jgi:hypothetical protein
MNRNNYKEFLKEVEKSVPAGAGTTESNKNVQAPAQSSEALKWARDNPSDPKSKQILQTLKRFGVQ